MLTTADDMPAATSEDAGFSAGASLMRLAYGGEKARANFPTILWPQPFPAPRCGGRFAGLASELHAVEMPLGVAARRRGLAPVGVLRLAVADRPGVEGRIE